MEAVVVPLFLLRLKSFTGNVWWEAAEDQTPKHDWQMWWLKDIRLSRNMMRYQICALPRHHSVSFSSWRPSCSCLDSAGTTGQKRGSLNKVLQPRRRSEAERLLWDRKRHSVGSGFLLPVHNNCDCLILTDGLVRQEHRHHQENDGSSHSRTHGWGFTDSQQLHNWNRADDPADTRFRCFWGWIFQKNF